MWIESHDELERHPKILELQRLTGWDLDQAIGKLHRLWWWCAKYAEDGDLSGHGLERVNAFIGLEKDARVLAQAGFVDLQERKQNHARNVCQIHDWWDFFGRFLQVKYKNRPDKWLEIRNRCKGGSNNRSNNRSKGGCKPQYLTNQPNQTLTTKEMEPLVDNFGKVGNGGGSLRSAEAATLAPFRQGNGHVKGCTCETCWKRLNDPLARRG